MKRKMGVAALLAAMVSLAVAQEAPKQTADGAFKFLDMIVKQQGVDVDLYGLDGDKRYGNYATVYATWTIKSGFTYKDGSKLRVGPHTFLLPAFRADAHTRTEKCESSFAWGSAAVAEADAKVQRWTKEHDWGRFEDLKSFTPPTLPSLVRVNWSKVPGVQRDKGSKKVRVVGYGEFTLATEEIATRVHYAMEFLKNACDPTASTGF